MADGWWLVAGGAMAGGYSGASRRRMRCLPTSSLSVRPACCVLFVSCVLRAAGSELSYMLGKQVSTTPIAALQPACLPACLPASLSAGARQTESRCDSGASPRDAGR